MIEMININDVIAIKFVNDTIGVLDIVDEDNAIGYNGYNWI